MTVGDDPWLFDLSTAPASWHVEDDSLDEDLLLDPDTPLWRGTVPPRKRLHARLVEAHGGIIAARELVAGGLAPEHIRLLRDFDALIRIRKGWYALPGLDPVHALAWRIGGPLACVSALEHHRLLTSQEVGGARELHVCLATNSSRRLSAIGTRAAACELGVPERGHAPVLHWSTTAYRSGTRRAVSVATALKQARHCRPLPARLARERAAEGRAAEGANRARADDP